MIDIESLLGDEAEYLLAHTCSTIPKKQLHLPGPNFIDRVWALSDRTPNRITSYNVCYTKLLRIPSCAISTGPR